MSANTAIEWADATWNPLLGCIKVSAGCQHCYAIDTAYRQEHAFRRPEYQGLTVRREDGSRNWTGKVTLLPERLTQPLTWKKPRRIFANSMSDLFHVDVPDEFIDQVFGAMALAHWHTFQVLTKRPDRMAAYLSAPGVVRRICEAAGRLHMQAYPSSAPEFTPAYSRAFNRQVKAWWDHAGKLTAWTHRGGIAAEMFEREEPGREYPSWLAWPLPNVWLGTSVEDQEAAGQRIPHLLRTPAAVRFLSCEPLLGPVQLPLSRIFSTVRPTGKFRTSVDGRRQFQIKVNSNDLLLHWVIAGGESGAKHRPFDADWARSLRDQCQAAGIPFFFKQHGGRTHAAGGRELDGRTWEEFPQVVAA